MPKHEHRFKLKGPPGTVLFCEADVCGEVRIVTSGKIRTMRRPTVDEQLTIIAHMMQATAIGQAMQIIHGKERGIQRAREVLGYV